MGDCGKPQTRWPGSCSGTETDADADPDMETGKLHAPAIEVARPAGLLLPYSGSSHLVIATGSLPLLRALSALLLSLHLSSPIDQAGAAGMAANSAETARALEQCERDLDLAIERLVNLRLDPEHEAGEGAAPDIIHDVVHRAPAPAAAKAQSAAPVPSGGSGHVGWIDRLINEMLSAADVDDARAREARFLEDFDASVAVGPDDVVVALRENRVLKKAVLLQHRLDNEKEAANRELRRQLAGCQERVRSLETDNYALSMYLRRAQPQGGSSMTGRFHPEVF